MSRGDCGSDGNYLHLCCVLLNNGEDHEGWKREEGVRLSKRAWEQGVSWKMKG